MGGISRKYIYIAGVGVERARLEKLPRGFRFEAMKCSASSKSDVICRLRTTPFGLIPTLEFVSLIIPRYCVMKKALDIFFLDSLPEVVSEDYWSQYEFM